MTCADFLASYSQLRDGDLPSGETNALHAHLSECSSCARYDRVVQRGVEVLRDAPAPRVRDDFEARVRHSIYSLDEAERARRFRPHGPSGGGAMAVMAAAALLVAVVWTPTLMDSTPTVELPALVIDQPAESNSDVPFVASGLGMGPEPSSSLVYESDLWTGSNALLFEHSPLYHRYRDPALVRAGIQ